jgi:hypothetical protein
MEVSETEFKLGAATVTPPRPPSRKDTPAESTDGIRYRWDQR